MRYLGTAILIFSLTFGGVRQEVCLPGRPAGSLLDSPAARRIACSVTPSQSDDPCCQRDRSQDAQAPRLSSSSGSSTEDHSNRCPCTGEAICSCFNPVDQQIPVPAEWTMTMNPLHAIRTFNWSMDTTNIQPTSPPPKIA